MMLFLCSLDGTFFAFVLGYGWIRSVDVETNYVRRGESIYAAFFYLVVDCSCFD